MVSRGFSLIELMISLTVLALLALAAIPFSSAWLDAQHQSQLRNALLEGIAQARALALRNPRCLSTDDGEAVRLYYRQARVQLVQPTPRDNCADPISTDSWPTTEVSPYWQSASVVGNPQLIYCDTTYSGLSQPDFYLGFDSRALLTNVCTGNNPSQIAISLGKQQPLYVDLR